MNENGKGLDRRHVAVVAALHFVPALEKDLAAIQAGKRTGRLTAEDALCRTYRRVVRPLCELCSGLPQMSPDDKLRVSALLLAS